MSASGDERPDDEEPASPSGSDNPERKLHSSGMIQVVFRRNERNHNGLPVYDFSELFLHRLHSSGGGPGDRLLDRAAGRLTKKMEKKRRSPDMACMHFTSSLVELGYQVVSIEGAVCYPTEPVHVMSIQFVRPV